MKLGDKNNLTIEAVSTGSLLLDEAIGVGGYPKGKIIEIFGPESSGKTTLSFPCYCCPWVFICYIVCVIYCFVFWNFFFKFIQKMWSF
ncbi:hypothetical protein C6B38_07880 [Spiroplasma sp. ChiS]|nr:hypothetical protein [Spiroplasma sp. ChiS]PQP78154.1 hypothetical protein C6B38_07880 [Spiroplasma sp. ChiS]